MKILTIANRRQTASSTPRPKGFCRQGRSVTLQRELNRRLC